jgi:hypothetical protein
MAEWKKVIVSGSNAELATLNATAVTASLEGNVVGNLTGTASWATTASWALNSPASISSSYAVSASFAQVAALANEATILETARDFSVTGSGISAAAVSFDGSGDVVLNASIDAGAVTTAKIADDAVTNDKLENDTVTVGSTNIALGASATTLAGLTSVTSTDFIGDLTGNADTATNADDSDLLRGQNGAYYTNATNINAGTIDNAYLPSAINVTSVTASLLGNVIGDLTGNADTATNADDSDLLRGQNGAYYTNATNINAGTIDNAYLPAAINVTSVTASLLGNVIGDLTGTASYALQALSAPSSSYALSSSFAQVAALANEATILETARDFSITGSGISATAVTFDGSGDVVLNASIDAGAVTTAKIADDAVTNDKLENSSLTVGSTSIALGASATTLAGLTSVTSTGFTGALTGNADTATTTAAASTGQGKVTVGTNVDIDLGLQTTASPTFANLAIAGSGSYSGALVVQGDLTVNGTASFINTQDLLIEDKFVTFASGSTTATDGGFIVSQASGNVGQAFAFQSAGARWGVESGVAYNATSITPDAYVSLVAVTQSDTDYQKLGNIFVSGSGDIFMWG